MKTHHVLYAFLLFGIACKKGGDGPAEPTTVPLTLTGLTLNDAAFPQPAYAVSRRPAIALHFSVPVDKNSVAAAITLTDSKKAAVPLSFAFAYGDSLVTVTPSADLPYLTKYDFTLSTALHSAGGTGLTAGSTKTFVTTLDSSRKFPALSDSALLDLVEQQTLKYFYDFGHPISGLVRERNTSDDIVTTGGTGFGIMALLAGVHRNFITRADALTRLTTIVDFLTNKAERYKGAFPHWLNGSTGETVPFSANDDGADLVETSYLMQGLLCARQFFNGMDGAETSLRSSINDLWHGVNWSWFRQNGQNVLYWHWSPDFQWTINQPVTGWNEALIVYALAASADTGAIPKIVYDDGWAKNGAIRNGQSYFGYTLPLGEPEGGPLFFAHYSFLGINPTGLADAYADYWAQNTAHSNINYKYCVANPAGFNGYSDSCWGLTASDDNLSGYDAHSPTNDVGVISPTAAISSLPYSPAASMQALHFFYYTLGDKLWGQYGLKDAFNLSQPWFADSYLAIDQGPEIVMIENYRTGLLWNLFMGCPEVKRGLKALGFSSPNL